MSAAHLRVEVHVVEDDRVGARQVEPLAAGAGGQQERERRAVGGVERVADAEAVGDLAVGIRSVSFVIVCWMGSGLVGWSGLECRLQSVLAED